MKRITGYRSKAKRTMLSPLVSVKGMKWIFHKTDDDYYPSVPHGHSEDGKYKLELWNGNIYDLKSGKLIFRAKKKDMKALLNYPGFREFVEICREEYRKRNPSVCIPALQNKGYLSRKNQRKRMVKDSYVFFIRHDKV